MDYEYEPMEVDLSGNSINAMDISYNDFISITPDVEVKKEPCETSFVESEYSFLDSRTKMIVKSQTGIKRFTLNVPVQRYKMYHLSYTMLSIIFSILALISLMTYQIVTFECSKELDLNVLKHSLSNNLVGQTQAIDSIVKALEEKSLTKILLLYGGTGVGKTFTISLLLENLYHYANIYHYTKLSFVDGFSTDLMVGLTFCPTSLIVIDDLDRTDMQITDHIGELIKRSKNLNKNITIILVFNCDIINDQYIKKCDYSFYTDLKQTFSEITASKWFIKYNSLTEEHLRKCIEKEFDGKSPSETVFHDIVKNFNVTNDGCKGVYTKIKLLNIF